VLENRRGSRFWLCELSKVDARFPRYPPLPVAACIGFTPRSMTGGDGGIPVEVTDD
jgi:hypothetical protein